MELQCLRLLAPVLLMLSGCANQEVLQDARQFYVGRRVVVNQKCLNRSSDRCPAKHTIWTDKNCIDCSYWFKDNVIGGVRGIQYRQMNSEEMWARKIGADDFYTIQDVRFSPFFTSEKYIGYVYVRENNGSNTLNGTTTLKDEEYMGYYLVLANERQTDARKVAVKRNGAKENTAQMEEIKRSFPLDEYRFPISEEELKSHKFPEALNAEAHKNSSAK